MVKCMEKNSTLSQRILLEICKTYPDGLSMTDVERELKAARELFASIRFSDLFDSKTDA